jgi:hypothetical protein
MTQLAAIRPDEVNLPLFLHVLGAMLLVGLLLAVSAAILIGWRRTEPADAVGLTRMGFWTLIGGVFPAYLLMRIGAMWTESEAFGDLPEPAKQAVEDSAWIGIGYLTADIGSLLILISIVLSVIGLRATRRGGGLTLGRVVGVIATLLLVAYIVAVWAMTTKPD